MTDYWETVIPATRGARLQVDLTAETVDGDTVTPIDLTGKTLHLYAKAGPGDVPADALYTWTLADALESISPTNGTFRLTVEPAVTLEFPPVLFVRCDIEEDAGEPETFLRLMLNVTS